MAYCHIAHDCIVGDNCIFSNNSTLAGHITVGDYVVLAGMTAVHQFCMIGNHAFVTGGSLVRKDVPPYVKAAREPLSYVGINSIGLRRRGFDSEKIRRFKTFTDYFINETTTTPKPYRSSRPKWRPRPSVMKYCSSSKIPSAGS